MISRRNIRVKAMQALYAVDSTNGTAEGIKLLQYKFQQSGHLFTYIIFFLTQLARYVERDAIRKAGKHLPTYTDLHINTKLAGNEMVWKIVDNPAFISAAKSSNSINIMDEDLLKALYISLIETEEYKEYINEESRNKKLEKKILEFIFNNIMLPNDRFTNHLEENFTNWDDDAEMMQALVMNYLNRPQDTAFTQIISKDKLEFAQELVSTVIEKDGQLMDIIKPKLKNWDADRIASLDMILLKMGVSEFLYFDTIPTKVTINEYIDIAKAYSTPQSGQFVNGILDGIHKDLLGNNKIEKTTYKKTVL